MTTAADATVKIRKGHRTGIVSIPLFLLWIVFVPFLLALSPLILIACVLSDVSPFQIFSTMWRMVDGLAGAEVEIKRRKRSTLIRIW